MRRRGRIGSTRWRVTAVRRWGAGYFIAEQHPELDETVYRGIEGELDRIIEGQSVFRPEDNAHALRCVEA